MLFRNRLSFCFCTDQPIYFIKKGIFGSKSFRRKISDHFVEIYGAFVFLRKPFGNKDIRPFCSVFLSILAEIIRLMCRNPSAMKKNILAERNQTILQQFIQLLQQRKTFWQKEIRPFCRMFLSFCHE